jgi:glyoxylase-like metal-dependent hydrolase (beta-lactamase superfamily II)
VIVIDTGETSRIAERGYSPAWHPYLRYSMRMRVAPEEEVGPQLTRLGIGPRDVRWVVMTHLHTDHRGGLRHLPHSEVLISRSEMKAAGGLAGRVRGYVNNRFPRWLDPTIIDLAPTLYGPFPKSMALTRAEDVVLLPVSGHTPGMMAALVDEGDQRLCSPATPHTPSS